MLSLFYFLAATGEEVFEGEESFGAGEPFVGDGSADGGDVDFDFVG